MINISKVEDVQNLNSFYNNIFDNVQEEAEGDYRVEDILYCGKCKSPKEAIIENWADSGYPKTISISCQCREREIEKRRKEEEKHKQQDAIQRFKNHYISDKQYLNMTFDKADKDSNLKWAYNYVEAWEEIKDDENAGLLLYGDTGTGKTFVACCIGNALLEKSVRVMISNITDLLDKVAGFGNSEKEETLKKIQNCDLLIVDDFGATRETEFANEQIYKIIDARYRAQKPMIVTTNLAPNLMLNENDIGLKRTYQRIIERCRAVTINGNNRRLDKAKESKRKMDDILFNNKACQGE